MSRSFSTLLCAVPLGIAITVAPAGVAAADEAQTPEATDAEAPEPIAAGARLGRFAGDVATSIAKPLRTVGLHVHSYHSKVYARSYTEGRKRMKFNNQTRGLYLLNEDGWGLGFYRNSLHRNTAYAGRFINVIGPLDVSIGVATGYNRSVVPMIVPSVRVGPVRLWVQPAIGGPNNTTMAHVSLELDR